VDDVLSVSVVLVSCQACVLVMSLMNRSATSLSHLKSIEGDQYGAIKDVGTYI